MECEVYTVIADIRLNTVASSIGAPLAPFDWLGFAHGWAVGAGIGDWMSWVIHL